MTMKMITAAVALVAGTTLAATPDELFAAKDWATIADTCSLAQITNRITAANSQALYDACIASTNKNAALRGCALAKLGYGSVETAFRNAIAKKNYNAANWLNVNTSTNHAWTTELLTAFAGDQEAMEASPTFMKNVIASSGYAKAQEAEAIAFCTAAVERRDWLTAAALFQWWETSSTGWMAAESETLKAWRDANAAAVMSGLAANPKWAGLYGICLFNISRRDLAANDSANTEAMKYFYASVFGDKLGGSYSGSYCEWALGRASHEAFFKNATDPVKIFANCRHYNYNPSKKKELILANWEKISTGKTVAFKAARELGDGDKVLDALLITTDNLTADEINYVITKIVGFDADHRAADVLRVLKNINAKYTLKLYDDRDTWEPILSKVRALIDCR